MKIEAKLVGTRSKAYRTDISWRHTMNYAAAVGDDNPCYFDDERSQGIMAPPMFSVAVTWPVVAGFWQDPDGPDLTADILSTLVHYSEHLVFYRPLIPGDSLTLEGEIAAILPRKAGTLMVLRIDAFDGDGEPVFTEFNGGFFRGVKCDGGGKGEQALPSIPACENDGSARWRSHIHINRMQNFIYDGCTNIVFPIHTSRRIAHQAGLPDIILQGTATLALAARELINKEAGMNPSRLQALSCRFSGMVLPETDIRVEMTGKKVASEKTDLFFVVTDAAGQKVIREGYASLRNK